jgi:hypothetical protein
VELAELTGMSGDYVVRLEQGRSTIPLGAGIFWNRVPHDAVTPNIRSGVGPGVSTMSWLAFLVRQISKHQSVHTAGWIRTGLAGPCGPTVLWVARRHRHGNADIQR